MAQNNAEFEPEFDDEIEPIRIGTKYESVTTERGIIKKGDIVLFDDRYIDERDLDRGVHSRTFVGYVDAILDPDRGDEPMIFTTAACGKVPVADVEIFPVSEPPRDIRVDPQSGLQKFAEQFFKNDANSMTLEWGENIDGSGDDFKRTTN